MELGPLVGAGILFLLLLGYIILSSRSIGFAQTMIGIIVAVVVTALVVIAISLILGVPVPLT